MKPLSLAAVLIFVIAIAWVITLSPSSVRNIQKGYYSCISPFVSAGSSLETQIKQFNDEIKHSNELSLKLKELKFPQREKFSAVTANILRRNPSTWWQTSVVNRGLQDGVADFQPVLSSEGLVGKVELAGESESTILLLSDEKCQVSAKIAGTHELGILSGQRVQSGATPVLNLKYLSPNARDIKPGMKVFTTGRGGLFPPDILLGTIEKYTNGSFYAEAIVRPSVDFEKIRTVFILTNTQQ